MNLKSINAKWEKPVEKPVEEGYDSIYMKFSGCQGPRDLGRRDWLQRGMGSILRWSQFCLS